MLFFQAQPRRQESKHLHPTKHDRESPKQIVLLQSGVHCRDDRVVMLLGVAVERHQKARMSMKLGPDKFALCAHVGQGQMVAPEC
eukprot:6205767-Pleurochrysis_carterae.AAC.1